MSCRALRALHASCHLTPSDRGYNRCCYYSHFIDEESGLESSYTASRVHAVNEQHWQGRQGLISDFCGSQVEIMFCGHLVNVR